MKFIEDMSVKERQKYFEEKRIKHETEKQADEKNGSRDETRYRCEQINIVKLNGVISAHSTIKTEYLLKFIGHNNAIVTLTDSIYNFFTRGTEELVGFISSSDQIKGKMHYALDDRGRIKEILNKKELIEKWNDFRVHLEENPYIQKLSQEAKKNIIETGDREFSSSDDILFKNSYANLFNQIIFGQYLKHDFYNFQGEIIKTHSHFFPDIKFDVNCETKKQTEDEEFVTYLNMGKPLYVNISDMILLYEKFYKEQLQYKFTDYKYELEMNYTISKKDNRITEANASINEAVKNNMESQVLYNLRKVEL